jgi:hypothetical protein
MRGLLDDLTYRARAGRMRAEMLAVPTPAERVDRLAALVNQFVAVP